MSARTSWKPVAVALTAGLTATLTTLPMATSAAAADISHRQCASAGPSAADQSLAVELRPKLTAWLANSLTAERVSCARAIVDATMSRLDRAAAIIAVTTAIPESTLLNGDTKVDHSSLGLFQQLDAWGSRENRLNPAWATHAFLTEMERIYRNDRWRSAPIGEVSQAVQRSGHPDRYAPQVADATLLVDAVLRTREHTSTWSLSDVLSSTRPTITAFGYGTSRMTPIAGDWDGDGDDTVGMYDAGVSTFLLRQSNSGGNAQATVAWGRSGDQPLVGDWAGDGADDLGVYRPSTTEFFFRTTTATSTTPSRLGRVGDLPLVGNFAGDRRTEIGVFRPATREFFLNDDQGRTRPAIGLGAAGDRPIIGDWNGDGLDDVGVYRPSTGQFFHRFPDGRIAQVTYGSGGATPVTGDWNGDGTDTHGVVR